MKPKTGLIEKSGARYGAGCATAITVVMKRKHVAEVAKCILTVFNDSFNGKSNVGRKFEDSTLFGLRWAKNS